MTNKQAIYYELLVLRCKRGQRQAFEELVRAWEKRLFYYIRKLIDNEQDAWQILQDTWVKVLQKIKTLKEPKKLPVWLYSIARNTAMDYLRRRYSKKVLFENSEQLEEIQDHNENLDFENAEQVHYALAKISLHHKEILTLFFLQYLSVEDIAEVIKIPPGTVKSRLYHAKKALKAVLQKEAKNYE